MDTSKIIRGVVSNGRYTVTAPIVKEDYGLYLQIEGVELPSTYEVDFSNSENSGTSVTMIGNADGVLIPRQFIDSGKDVFAFLYHVGANYGRTVYKFRIPNKVRPDRTDEQPTPEEQSVIDQAINALNEAVAQTAQDVISSDQSAQSASEFAEQAESARNTAQGYASNAQLSATQANNSAISANQSASASAQSASQSAQIKADVEDLADDAQGYAQSAEQSAQNAHTYALSANAASGTAENFADVASGYASQAQSSAQTASAKAQDASQSASTASQKATESAQSASQALTYKTEAESAKTASQTAQGLAESARDSAIQAKNDAESAKEDAETARDEAQQAVESISGALADKADVITDTASGAVASFSDGADNIPLKSLVVNINPIQDLSHGDPSPENICPISGWTGMEIQHDGKNLLPLNIWELPYNRAVGNVIEPILTDRSWTQEDGKITYVTTSTYTNVGLMTPLLPAGDYYFTLDKLSSGIMRYTRYGLDKTFKIKSMSNSSNINSHYHAVHTLDEDGYIAIKLDNGNTASQTLELNVQIAYGDTETPYENYVGRTIPISWQTEVGTVYGGRLDVLTGILTVYPYYASYNGETLTGRWISDRDVYAVGTTPTIGAQVVNIGAQGTEIQLEPHDVKSLLGANNIFADTGECSVEYRADTKLYIERLTAPDSADMIADANFVSGQYFMVGNSLYKATANIANGGQIIVGTNCTRVSLAQALNEINA